MPEIRYLPEITTPLLTDVIPVNRIGDATYISQIGNLASSNPGAAAALLKTDASGVVKAIFQDKGGAVYNVKAYGAVGNGVADDTAAIQAAISAVPVLVNYSTVIYLPGRHLISDTLVIPDDTRIVLRSNGNAGAFGSGLYCADPNKNFIEALLPTVFSAEGVHFEGAGYGTGTGKAIVIGVVFDSRITNCWFNGIPDACVYGTPQGYHFTDNAFEVSNVGINIVDGAYNIIANNRFYDNLHFGVYIANGHTNTVNNNIFDVNGDNGDAHGAICLSNTGGAISNCLIENNAFFNNLSDIVLEGVPDFAGAGTGIYMLMIKGNTSQNVKRRFLFCGSAELVDVAHNIVLNASQAAHNTYAAIDIRGISNRVRIIENAIYKSGAVVQNFGVMLGATTVATTLTGNTLEGQQGGVYIDAGATFAIRRDNIGHVTRNYGAEAAVVDGGTIDHGLVTTPLRANVSPSVAGEMVTVTTLDATHITVAIKKHDGTAGTAQTIYWEAEV
jgi:parallel beta-helix repeat protein